MNDNRWPGEPEGRSGEPWNDGWTRSLTRRALAAAYAGLVGLSQSRGLFAVIGATVATSIFVLFSWLPGNGGATPQSPPTFTDRTGDVEAKAG
ncbi:MAG TPA: hypothetical protein VHH34_05130, partial [Pseudonocardiaceae bacterium]|nr:hypothetical protein [Pseudonocardiaceae bacterium]